MYILWQLSENMALGVSPDVERTGPTLPDIVADGSDDAETRLRRVLTSDPAMGVIRHVDAGYEDAVQCAREREVSVPGLNY